MRLGLIARRDNTGLGYQTLSYYEYLKPSKTMVIDLSILNGNSQNIKWYPNAQVVLGIPKRLEIIHFLQDLDVVLTAETPYNYELYEIAKSMGVKVANVINWEFFDHILYPELPLPDLIIMPSAWHSKEARAFSEKHGIKCIHLHHPVDRNKITYTNRTMFKPFHVAGKPAIHDRNGTWDFMTAVPDGRVVTQSEDLARQIRMRYRNSNVFTDIDDQNQMYNIGNVMVLPRKYGGNCLPMNEALAAGCPVIMTDISPNNHLLPKEWLVPAVKISQFTPRTVIDIYEIDTVALADKLRWFKEEANMSEESEKANKIANAISWDMNRVVWLEVLGDL